MAFPASPKLERAQHASKANSHGSLNQNVHCPKKKKKRQLTFFLCLDAAKVLNLEPFVQSSLVVQTRETRLQ